MNLFAPQANKGSARTKTLFLALSLVLLQCTPGFGQLLQWNTFNNLGTETTEPSVFNNANISAANLTLGNITAAANGNRFGGSNWWNTGNTAAGNTLTEAIAGGDYIQFIVTPNAGFSFTPTSFVFTWDRSGTGPSSVTLRSSADGFSTDLGTLTGLTSGGSSTTTTRTITISGLTNLTAVTTFRLYGYGATAAAGTGGFDNASSVVDVQLNGTTAATATPSIAITEGSIAAGSVNQGDVNVILQRFDLAVTSANATLNGLTVTTAGTYAPADIVNLKVRYSTDATLDAGDATLSTKTTSLDAGSQVFPSFSSQSITNNTTGYIFVTADIALSATAGNAINIASTAFSNISFSGTVNKTGTDPVAAGGVKTITAIPADVTLSSPNPAVSAAGITQNTSNNVVYRFDLAAATASANLTGVTINTSGTYTAADVANFKCWYSADNSFSSVSDVLLSTIASPTGNGTQHVFPSFTNQNIASGTTGFIFITTDVPCAAVNGHTVIVNAITTGDISYSPAANESGSAFAGGTQTVSSSTPNNVTGASGTAGNQQVTVAWTNPVAGCFDEVMIVAAPAANTGTPAGDGSAYTANLTYGSGTGLGNGFVVYKGSTSPQIITGLTNGTTYFFKIFSRNDAVWSAVADVSAMPDQPVAPGEILINQMSPDYNGASDEYVELVNTTGRVINLATLKLSYASAAGGGGSAGGTLSGTLQPHSFWLLSPNATITVGQTSALSRDGSIVAGFSSSTGGQIAIQRVSDNTIIDGLGYGTISGGSFTETSAAALPPGDGGLKRVTDGADNNTNSTGYTTVTQANIYLRNSSSRLANTNASIAAGTYTDVSVTGNASLAGNVTVSKKLSTTAGLLSIGSNTLTLNGSIVPGAGGIKGSAASNLVIGTAIGSLSLDQTSAANRSLNNLTLNSGASVTLGNALDIYGAISLASASLDLAGKHLTLKSTSTGTARVGNLTGNTFSNATNVTVERYIPAKRAWRLLSVPTTGSRTIRQEWQEGDVNISPAQNNLAGFGTIISSGYASQVSGSSGAGFDAQSQTTSIKSYNGSSFVSMNSVNTGISTTGGYFIFIRGDRSIGTTGTAANETVLRTTGTLKTGNQSAIPASGFSLIGNPFASEIDFAQVFANAGTSGISNTLYLWDAQLGATGGYETFNGANNYQATVGGGSWTTSDVNSKIQSGQAFFVNGTGQLTIEENDKTNGANTKGLRPVIQATFSTRLLVGDRAYDGNMTVFGNNYSNDVDKNDAVKFPNPGEHFAITSGGKELAVEARQQSGKDDEIMFSMKNMKEQSYTLEFRAGNLGGEAWLIDNYLETKTPISLGETTRLRFSVTADPASAATNRFKVVLRPIPATDSRVSSIKVLPNPVESGTMNVAFIKQPKGRYSFTLTDLSGRVLYNSIQEHAGGSVNQTIALPSDIASGVYHLVITLPGKTKQVQKYLLTE